MTRRALRLLPYTLFAVLLASAPSSSSSDRRQVIAQYAFAVALPDGHYGLVSASLRENRKLTIRLDDYGRGFGDSITAIHQTSSRLSRAAFAELRKDVVILANAEISVNIPEVTCHGVALLQGESNDLLVRRDYSYGMDEFRGDLEVVLGSNRCFEFTRVLPAFDRNNPVAHELREKLEILGAQLLGGRIDGVLY